MLVRASATIKEIVPKNAGNMRTAKKQIASVDPNHLYVVVSGLHGDEPNQNGDFFLWDELIKNHHQIQGKKVYATWNTMPNLVNHDNLRVVGEIIDSWPVPEEKSIDMLVKVDRKHNWLVQGIEKSNITDVSMGCSVAWSKCSRCQNIAKDESEWCDCLSPSALSLKGKADPETGELIYEDNRDITGVEVSWITFGEGADVRAEQKVILASKESTIMSKPQVNTGNKGSIKPFARAAAGATGAGGVGAPDPSGIMASLLSAAKAEAKLNGALDPQNVLNMFEVSGEITMQDMVHLASRLGLGTGFTPIQAYAAFKQAVSTTAGEVEVEQTTNAPSQSIVTEDTSLADIVEAQAVESPQTPEKPESVLNTLETERIPVTDDSVVDDEEEEAVVENGNQTAEVVKKLRNLLAQLENAAPAVTPATENSVNKVAPNPELKDQKALQTELDKGQEHAKDPVDRVPKGIDIKTMDKGKPYVPLAQQMDTEPNAEGGGKANPNTLKGDELKTDPNGDGLNSKTEVPSKDSKAALDVTYVADEANPVASYWRIAVANEPVFGVPAIKAFGEDISSADLDKFASIDYGNALRHALRTNGLANTLANAFGGTRGATVVASNIRIAQLDDILKPGGAPAGKPPMGSIGPDGMPSKPGGAPKDIGKGPKGPGPGPGAPPMMNIDKNVADELEDGKKLGKSPFLDMLVDVVAPIAAKDAKWSVDDIINELGKLGKGEESLELFQGKLEKKVEELKSKKDTAPKPEKDDEDKDKLPPFMKKDDKDKDGDKDEDKKKKLPPFMKKDKDDKESNVEAALAAINDMLPEITSALEKGSTLETSNHLRIRAIQTKKLAVRMAQLAMIEEDEIHGIAADLAKKSDEEIAAVQETVDRAETGQAKLAKAASVKSGRKIEAMTGGIPIMASLPMTSIDRTDENLAHTRPAKDNKFDLGWSRPPQVVGAGE